jgi:hypothetical protein
MISHITIDNMVANSADEIARVLKADLKYLYASRICLFPRFENGVFSYTAYIKVGEWVDCDAAYYMIRAMKDGKRTQIYVKKGQLWDISVTAEADICHTNGSDAYKKWTTEFATLDTDSDTDYEEYEMDVETITNAKVDTPDTDFSAFIIGIRD